MSAAEATLCRPRLTLRPWRVADRDPFAQMNANPQVMAYFPATLSRAQSDALADSICERMTINGWGFFAVEITDSIPFIGFVGLNIPKFDMPFSPCVEIGWRLGAARWGRGYASEAAEAVVGFGFANARLHEIVSFTALINHRSRALMKRLGMTEDEAPFDHPQLPAGHRLQRHCLFRLSPERWRSQQPTR